MIDLSFDHAHRILLVRYALEITVANLDRLDSALKSFFARRGIVDTIVDFTGVPRLDFEASIVSDRGRRPSRKSDTRRVFVVASPVMFGVMRLYSAHQENRGDKPPAIVA